MLADFYIPWFSNDMNHLRRTEKSFRRTNFVQVVFLGQHKTSVPHHSWNIEDIEIFFACDRKVNLALFV